MQAVDRMSIDEQLAYASKLFPLAPVPNGATLVDGNFKSLSEELFEFLEGRTWEQVGRMPELRGRESASIDLGNISLAMSRVGLVYFMPGLLVHFLNAGTYQNSIWGPTFYFNFVRRLQADDTRIAMHGGCDQYFNFSPAQNRFCAEFLKRIYARHGDPYEDFDARGFEWQDVARCSIARALKLYWAQL